MEAKTTKSKKAKKRVSKKSQRKGKEKPLFVVTNRGKDVESAKNMIDALMKKLGLTQTVEYLEGLFKTIIKIVRSVEGHQGIIILQQLMDRFLQQLLSLWKEILPQGASR